MSKQTFHLPTWRRKPTADEAAPPRRGQWSKSPAELDFYGEFYAALCGAPVLPVLPKAKCGRRLAMGRAVRQKGHRPFSAFFKKVIVQDEAFTFYSQTTLDIRAQW